MSNIRHIDTVNIAEHFVCAIEYGDYSGLSEEDIFLLEDFLAEYPSCTFEYSKDVEYTMDDVTGFFANCYEVKVWGITK